MSRFRKRPESVEGAAARCAALLRGGVAPGRVFSLIAEEGGDRPAVVRIAALVRDGRPPAEAIAAEDRQEWRLVAVAWRLAEQSGAPLAPALERIAAALAALSQLRERRSVLLTGPRATVGIVAALPLLALLLGATLGFDPLPVLLSPAGAVLLAVGTALLVLGIVWARALSRSVERDDRVTGVELELAWVAMGGGASAGEALVRVADGVDALGISWVPFDAFLEGGLLRSVLRTAESVGLPVGALLVEEAQAARAREHAELERAAERLGVRVLIPLGVCVLPSFIVLGVLPVLISMLSGQTWIV